MSTVNTERLQRLADKLEGKGPYKKDGPISRKEFDIGTWFDKLGEGKKRIADPIKSKSIVLTRDDEEEDAPIKKSATNRNICGTAACACGHAATDPWFQRRGFRLLTIVTKFGNGREHIGRSDIVYTTGSLKHFDRDDVPCGIVAAARFFNISHETAQWLFLGSSYGLSDNEVVTPKKVARRIAQVIKNNGVTREQLRNAGLSCYL